MIRGTASHWLRLDGRSDSSSSSGRLRFRNDGPDSFELRKGYEMNKKEGHRTEEQKKEYWLFTEEVVVLVGSGSVIVDSVRFMSLWAVRLISSS